MRSLPAQTYLEAEWTVNPISTRCRVVSQDASVMEVELSVWELLPGFLSHLQWGHGLSVNEENRTITINRPELKEGNTNKNNPGPPDSCSSSIARLQITFCFQLPELTHVQKCRTWTCAQRKLGLLAIFGGDRAKVQSCPGGSYQSRWACSTWKVKRTTSSSVPV